MGSDGEEDSRESLGTDTVRQFSATRKQGQQEPMLLTLLPYPGPSSVLWGGPGFRFSPLSQAPLASSLPSPAFLL